MKARPPHAGDLLRCAPQAPDAGRWAARRAVYEREKLRKQIPRLLLSDGRTIYEGLSGAGTDEDVIVGNPVSPGVVEGAVRVVFDPNAAQLAPGEILVCPGTDPSWTPLFLAAGGLVMEVGGLMTPGGRLGRRARIRHPGGGRRGSGHAPPEDRTAHPRGWLVRADYDIG